ncbi:MAG: DbpA RNA binding domain-containing protein [Treponema sp.]|nr:DbpA RNA binding domain-containing protein [Treponema sp.]
MALDKGKTGKKLKEILEKMNDTDAMILHEYYKLYKKEIPFFKRSWAAAWLLMHYDEEDISGGAGSDNAEKSAIVSIPEEESKRLFISVGKNRRLFPREIISLLMTNTSTAREDIGVIRILDNYSFVQVRGTKADEIIEKLSGFKFRGRNLAINYAKPKTSETDTE